MFIPLEPVLGLWMFSCALSGECITSIHLPSQAASSRRGSRLAHQLGFGLHQASLKEYSKGALKKLSVVESVVTNIFLLFSQRA